MGSSSSADTNQDPYHNYRRKKNITSGKTTQSRIYVAENRTDNKDYIMKKIDTIGGYLYASFYKEIKILKTCDHKNILKLKDVILGTKGAQVLPALVAEASLPLRRDKVILSTPSVIIVELCKQDLYDTVHNSNNTNIDKEKINYSD